MRAAYLRGRRTGVTINPVLLTKDGEGFDDINSFWNSASDVAKVSPQEVPVPESTEASVSDPTPVPSPELGPSPTVDQFADQLESPPETGLSPAISFAEKSTTRTLQFLDGAGSGEEDEDEAGGAADESKDEDEDENAPDREEDIGESEAEVGPAETPTRDSSQLEVPFSDHASSQAVSSAEKGPSLSRLRSPDLDDEGETEEERSPRRSTGGVTSDGGGSEGGAGTDADSSDGDDNGLPGEGYGGSSTVEESDDDEEEHHVVTDHEKSPAAFDDDASRGRVHAGSEDDTDQEGCRRSRRTRFPPLAHWKNERYIFERRASEGGIGEVLPTVAGISERTNKTPAKKSSRSQANKAMANKKRRREDEPMNLSELPKKRVVKKTDKCRVWVEKHQTTKKMRVFCRAATLTENENELPVTSNRAKDESDIACRAAQAFYTEPMSASTPGWISGQVALPCKGIKDAEDVGACDQIFFVGDCQPGSVEVAMALPDGKRVDFDAADAQRVLLGPGDQFFVPPYNIYRLENHSKIKEAKLSWIIIKPIEDPADSEEEASDA